jgi:hypothetical protein
VILRELYNWEKDKLVKETCLKVINILIAEEPEVGMDNLHEILIPEDLAKKLNEAQIQDIDKVFE